ncbi:hypothetical protein T459_20583 [Capsicum annuum]|uniref:Uncharacterized protein n=1 Tax=Capsicum annuum TaxID=4072 RepID=A0A2G2Z582_CAPAN|nr:hypothetical protein FXO37_03694 [Capsicum annuum]PHT77061.1 hypothetical protein T459_20583 [Capsicum annuum]
MEALLHFQEVTGLEANMHGEIQHLYLAGVQEHTREKLMQITGFSVGEFPMRYLGLPPYPRKWNKQDCSHLVHRIASKITSVQQDISRLQFINSVLFSIHNFWGSVFILPKSAFKGVDKMCREFL